MRRLFNIDYGHRHLLKCTSSPELAINIGDNCVVEVNRLLEYGRVAAIEEVADDAPAILKKLPVILRRATLQDQARASENLLFAKTALHLCQEKITALKLSMRLVHVYYSLDRSRITVVFTADQRVDFRPLLQALSPQIPAQIEMQQIKVRDEAATLGGMAPCGRKLCCASWLDDPGNVDVRMAKIQGLSLNPPVINGMCGRLKCCLSFENNYYREMRNKLPGIGVYVRCPEGEGKVVASQVLLRRVKVVLADKRVLEFEARDVKILGRQ